MKKGFFKEKLFYVSAIFFFVLSVVVVSIQNIYATEEPQQTNEEVYEVIDDVTNLEWVEDSSATLSWDEVLEANYYSVVVTVYENDGLTLVGSTTTGTTFNQLDVQQEIHDVVGESEYDYVKVKATVTSQFKQDDVVIKQGLAVETNLLEYQIVLLIKIPTPTNLTLNDDYSLTVECDMDNISEVVKEAAMYFHGDKTGCSGYVKISEINGHSIKFQIPDSWINILIKGGCTQVRVENFRLCAKEDMNYINSEYSEEPSNYITFEQYISVESITLSPETPYISKGNSYYLGKTITPLNAHYDEIEWTSDDETIVTVDETGKITGISAGTATVTATIGDVSTSVLVTVYEINTNVDTDQADDLIGEAGNVIDEIINNEDPNYSNTDIDDEDIDDVTEEIINGIQNDFEFWINCNWNGFGLGHYKNIWDYIIEWYYNQYGVNSWNFGWGYEIEYEIGYTDNNNYNHHLANITEFQNEYNITLDLPDDLPAHGNGKKRSYCLVRCHDGQLEIIPVMIDGKGKIHAKSNKYSDFILMYEDIDIVDDNEIYKNETHSATLGDDIKVNTYLELQDGVTDPSITFWLDENNKTTINGSLQNDGRYKFNFGVAGPQMSSTIYYTISAIKDGVEVITDVKTYSVREYCEAILNSDKSQKMKNLAAQMLNYGAYSQIYFGYDTEDLANKNLESLGYSTTLDTSVINQNAVVSFDEFDGDIKAQFTTNSLIFESEISLKYYMTLDDDIEEAYMAYRIKNSNSIYTYVKLIKSGNRYYAKIDDIKAPLLTDVYETSICVKNGNEYQQISNTKYYSPECYATAIYNNSTKQNMINAVVAMMMYCNAAREYFELD